MNQTELKKGDKLPKETSKEKSYSLQGFINKVHTSELQTFGNYYVDFNEFFNETNEYVGYMKKRVSMNNNDVAEKKQLKLNLNSCIKPTYFGKFSNETLFYTFYYMPRDTLQLFAAEELYKRKWKYHSEYQIWFSSEQNDGDKGVNTEMNLYFNPIDWKVMKYVYAPLNMKAFLPFEEVGGYIKELNIEK